MKKDKKKARKKSTFFKDLKNFFSKGNVINLAVAVIIGAAFGKITTSLVNDIIMPPLGLLIGGVDFKDLVITIKAATEAAAAVTINYGLFIQQVVEFFIIGFAIFIMLRIATRISSINLKKVLVKKKEGEATEAEATAAEATETEATEAEAAEAEEPAVETPEEIPAPTRTELLLEEILKALKEPAQH